MTGFLDTVVAGGMVTYPAGWNSIGGAEVHLELVLFGVAMPPWMGFEGTKDLADVEGAAGRPRHLAGGARRTRLAMTSAAMAVGAGFTIASLVAVPGLLPSSMFLVGSVFIAMAARSNSRVDGACVGDFTKNP